MKCKALTTTLALAIIALGSISAAEQKTTQQYLDDANKLLLSGRYREAIGSYDTAIEKDPQNYLSYFKRATTFLSLNKYSSAVKDFSKAIEIKQDFDQAYYQRARVYLKEGNFGSASSDLSRITDSKLKAKAEGLLEKVDEAQSALKAAKREFDAKKYGKCIKEATNVIRISPLHVEALKIRSNCKMAEGDLEGASSDLGRLARMNPGDRALQAKLAQLDFFGLNELDRGLDHIKAYLKSDPDDITSQKTFRQLRNIKARLDKLEADREKKKWNACNKAIAPASGKEGLLDEVDKLYASFIVSLRVPVSAPSKMSTHLLGAICEGLVNTKKWDDAIKYCSKVLDNDPENVAALGYKFDALIEHDDDIDRAQATFSLLEQHVNGSHGQQMHDRRMKLEQKKRLASRKDYYKALGVPKDASQSEIKRAYRKLAHQWHPDRYRGDLPKDKVEAKMADLNLAYEVLSSEESRAKYDQGEDPNDPTGGQGGFGGSGGPGAHFGGNPFIFQHGNGKPVFFQQGGGNPFSFQFGSRDGFPF